MSFNVYRSSAGSGKTFTLVKEYLKIVLSEPVSFRHILAITFTNKAANEMKERVLTALSELSRGADSQDAKVRGSLLPALQKETGLTEGEISRNANIVLEMILHNYADFAIGTIDGFSHRLIRTFAHDFGLPVNFNVELDADELLSTVVDLLLDRVGDDPALTRLLVRFLETRMEDEKGWNIGQILTGFAKILLDEEGQSRVRRLKHLSLENFQEITDTLYTRIRLFERTIQKMAQEGYKILKNGQISPSDLYQSEKGIWSYFANLAAGKIEKLEPNSYVVTTIEDDKWFSGKADASARDAISGLKPALLEIYKKLQEECQQNKQFYYVRKLLAKTIYPIAVLNEIERTLHDFKRQNNIVHISEFNTRIAGIVMNEPVPFIYERLGDKFHHLLIDEFQDTSALQWLNMVPLIENGLSGGYFNLLVGDGKQAIYRWRGGEVDQFSTLPLLKGSDSNGILLQREKVLEQHYSAINLEQNYRSKAEIVDFNNRFFKILAGHVLIDGKEKIYAGFEQRFNPQNTGGYISLELIEGEEGEADYREKTLQRIQSIISEAQQAHYNLRDVAILCRSNKNASLIARYLLEQGLDVVSAESLLIAGSQEVQFLINCLKYLFEPKNDIVSAAIKQYFINSGAQPGPDLTLEKETLALLPVYDLCESLIRLYKFNAVSDPYLRFFLDAVLKFSSKFTTGASEFLEWWEKNREKLSIIVPDELNAVRVMTIHKAKGLEFPFVILPFAVDALKNTRSYLWADLEPEMIPNLETSILPSDKEMEKTVFKNLYVDERQKSMLDLVNLLYVSMTRASERLYVLTKPPPKKQDELNSLPGFFMYFLQQENVWVDGQSTYSFGRPVEHTRVLGTQQKLSVTPIEVSSSDWRNKIKIRHRAPQSWDPDDPARKSLWGNTLHTIFSWTIVEEDVPHAIEKAIVQGFIGIEEAGKIETILRSVMNDPLMVRLFSREVKVKTEAEILLPEGSFYRPDRVVFDHESVTILDYKTGKQRAAYGEQLIRYSAYIKEMGYNNIRRFLVYVEPQIAVVEV